MEVLHRALQWLNGTWWVLYTAHSPPRQLATCSSEAAHLPTIARYNSPATSPASICSSAWGSSILELTLVRPGTWTTAPVLHFIKVFAALKLECMRTQRALVDWSHSIRSPGLPQGHLALQGPLSFSYQACTVTLG